MPIMPQYRSPYGQSIAELMMRQGEIAARGAERSGQIWGNAVQNLGQIGAQAYEQHRELKDQQTRNLGISKALDSWDGKDIGSLYRATAVYTKSPQDAMRLASSVAAFQELGVKQDERNQERLGIALSGIDLLPDEKFVQVYPELRAKAQAAGYDVGQFPEQADVSLKPVLSRMGMALRGEKPAAAADGFTLRPGEVRYNASGEQVASGGPAVEDAPAAGSFESFVVGKYGDRPSPEQMIAARAEWAKADDKPRDPLAAALAQSRIDALKDKDAEVKAEVESYVNAVGRGDYTIDRVPPTIQRQVMVAAEQRGLDTRTAAQKEIDSGAEQTIESLRQLREQATKTMTATTGPGAKVQGTAQRGLAYVGLAKETQLWDKQMGKLALLARQLGEKGVLSNFDVDRVTNLLPKLTESAELRDQALKNVEDIIFTGLRGKVSGRVKMPGAEGAEAPSRPTSVPENFRWDNARQLWVP